MGSGIRCATLAVALLVGLAVSPARGQSSDIVEFVYKASRGDAHVYRTSGTMQFSMEIGKEKMSLNGAHQARRVDRVLDVDAAGNMIVEVVLEDFQLTVDGKTEEQLDEPMVLKVSPAAKIIEKVSGPAETVAALEAVEDFPVAFAQRPVRPGDTWTREQKVVESGITMQATETLTLAAVERAGERRVARIVGQLHGTVTGANIGDLPPGARSRVTGSMRGTEELRWDLDAARLHARSMEFAVDMVVEVTMQGQTVRVPAAIKMTEQLEALPAPAPPQTVSPESLIVPGRGAGPFTLDTPVAELTKNLGDPNSKTTESGIAAETLRWTFGLVAYVGGDDKEKLAGLEVRDRRYRTEKGTGFGSSFGAVLFAHGLAPARIDVNVPPHGAVRMLVYNDLGIAFAITADKAHAGRAGCAPLNTVDAVIVFQPGGAGRLFRMP
jgi:hypothetical protein